MVSELLTLSQFEAGLKKWEPRPLGGGYTRLRLTGLKGGAAMHSQGNIHARGEAGHGNGRALLD
jgi:hypothetical protein